MSAPDLNPTLHPTLKPLRTIPGLQVHYAHDNLCFGTRGLGFYGSDDYGVNWRRYGMIPSGQTQRWLHLFAPYQRLIRGGINCVQPLHDPIPHDSMSSGPLSDSDLPNDAINRRGEKPTLENAAWVVMSGGSLYHVSENGQNVEAIWELRNGRRTLRRGLCVKAPYLFICDYWSNPKRLPISIYRIDVANKRDEVFYQFPAGSIRHIHNVEVDPFTGQIWLSTGDEDHECVIAHLDAETGECTRVGEGSQQWRAVSFIFRRDAVYWGMDDPLGENQIWRYDRKSGKLQVIGTVQGPVYYSKNTQDYIIFGTAVEFGGGQQDNFGRLYADSVIATANQTRTFDTDSITLQEVYRQPKDGWHARYFGYGLFEVNAGDIGHNRFWATHKGFQGGLRSTLFEICSS